MGGRPAGARRRRRAARRRRLGRSRRRPQRRPASPRVARRRPRRRARRAVPRRAHQPPRRRGRHLAGGPPERAVRVGAGRLRGGHARPLVPRRGVHRHLGGPRRGRGAVRGRVRRLRAAARRARPPGRCGRVASAEPPAQGAGVAAARRAGPHVEAEVPHRRGQRADRARAARARQRRAAAGRDGAARQGRRRPARRVGLLRRPRGALARRVADRAGGADRHPGPQRRGQEHAALARRRPARAFARSGEARHDPTTACATSWRRGAPATRPTGRR